MKNRMYYHLKETYNSTENRKKWCKIQSIRNHGLEPTILVFRNNLSEFEAYELEKALILTFGRIGFENGGCLTNICDDSRPPSQKGIQKTEEHKSKISKAHKGKKHTGYKKRSLESRQRASDRRIKQMALKPQRKITDEEREKASESHSKLWEITYPDCHKEILKNLSKFCREHNLSMPNLIQNDAAKGFSVKRLFEKRELHNKFLIFKSDGESFETNNLTSVCKKYNLSIGSMIEIAKGKTDIFHKGFSCKYI